MYNIITERKGNLYEVLNSEKIIDNNIEEKIINLVNNFDDSMSLGYKGNVVVGEESLFIFNKYKGYNEYFEEG